MRALPLALVLLGGCTTTQVASQHVPKPGYRCEASVQGDSAASAEATVFADGSPHAARLEWGARFANSQFIDAGALGFAYGASEVDPDNAMGTFRWAFIPPERGNHRLELTTVPDSQMAGRAPFATGYERHQHLGLMVPWLDLLTFARNADSLTLVIRHADGHEVMRQQVDPAPFRRAESEIAQVQAEVRAMLGDFRNRCTFVDDLEPDIVVV